MIINKSGIMNSFFSSYPVENATMQDAVTYVSVLFTLAAIDSVVEKEAEGIRRLVESNKWNPEIFTEAQKNTNITIESLNLSKEFIDVMAPYLIRDLCAVALISEGFSEEEEQFIHSVCNKVGVSEENYLKIRKAVTSQVESISNWAEVIAV